MTGKGVYSVGMFKAGLALGRLLPRAAAQAIGVAAGRAIALRRSEQREALRANLAHIMGSNGAAVDALCASNIDHFSRMLADYFLCAGWDAARANALLTEWRGFANLEAARARGKGIILVTAHLGNWELGGTLLAMRGLPMTVITLEEPTSELTRWRDEQRRRLGIKTIAVGPGHDFAFVEMIHALRRNEVVAMLVDRPYAGTGTAVKFFGRGAEFSTAPALLWQHTDAAVVAAFVLQNADRRYTAFADPMLPFERGEDARQALVQNTQRLASHFEAIIQQHPEQWFNYVPIWNS